MSRVLATGTIRDSHPSSHGPVVPLGAIVSWSVWGDWVEVLATTPTACALLGITVDGGTITGESEIELGIGTAGNEVGVGLVRLYTPNSGTGSMGVFVLPIPRSVPTGVRVALRLRGDWTGAPYASLLYAEGVDSDYVTDANLTSAPLGARGVQLTPNATPWANSDWYELIPALAEDGALAGLTMDNRAINSDAEWDLGIGDSGSETVITTLRSATFPILSGRMNFALLPGVYPLPMGTRVSVRMRKTGTNVTVTTVALLYYGYIASALQKVTQLVALVGYDEDAPIDVPASPCGGGGIVPTGTNPSAGEDLSTTTAPIPWVAITVDGNTYRYAAGTVPHSPVRYGRVAGFGSLTRELSEPDAGPRAATLSVSLIDTDRALRSLANNGTLKHALIEVFVSDLSTIIAEGAPYRAFRGRIAAWKAETNVRFTIDAEDELTARLTSIDAEDLATGITLLDRVSDANPEERTFGKPAMEVYGHVTDEEDDEPVGVYELVYSQSKSFSGADDLGNNHVFPLSVGAINQLTAVYGASPFEDPPVTRVRIPDSAWGDWLWAPTKPGWFLPDQFYFDEVHRWALLVGKDGHPTVEMARAGRIPFVANMCGYEDVGDSTGNLIDSVPRGFLHWINARLLQDGTVSDWPTTIFALGDFSFIHTPSFEAVHTQLDALGYLLGGVLGYDLQFQSWRDRWAVWLRHIGYGAGTGTNHNGQLMLARLDRTNSYSSAPTFGPNTILERGCAVENRDDAVENQVRYVSQQNYKSKIQALNPAEGERGLRDPYDGAWLYVPEPLEHEDSIDDLGGDPRGVRRSAVQEYGLTRDRDTADALAQERLDYLHPANGRAQVTFDLSLRDAWSLELGDVIALEHWDLPWTGTRRCQVRGLTWDLDQHVVTVRVWDVDDLLP